MKEKQSLTIMDGFQFGCGFFIAAFVYMVVVSLAMFILASVLGAGLLGTLGGF